MGSQRVRQDWATKHSTETVNVSLSFVRTGHTKHFSGPVFLGSHQPSQSFWNHSCFIVIPFKWILWHYAWFNEDITTHFFLYIHISDKHYPVNSQCLVCVCVCVCIWRRKNTWCHQCERWRNNALEGFQLLLMEHKPRSGQKL